MKKAQNKLLDYSLKVNNQWDWAMCFAVFFTKKKTKMIKKSLPVSINCFTHSITMSRAHVDGHTTTVHVLTHREQDNS